MLKAIQRVQINQTVTPKLHLLYRMIDAVLAGTVQNIVYVKLDRICRSHDCQAGMVMVRILQTVIMTIIAETDIEEIDTAEVHLRIIDEGVKEMTITEIILVKENAVTMITITIEAVREVAAEVEKGGEIVGAIERTGLLGIDLETDTIRVEIDLEKDTEIDLDQEIGLVKDRGTDLETEIGIVVDLVIGHEIGKDLGIEEEVTVKTTDLVDAVAKVLIMGITTVQMI